MGGGWFHIFSRKVGLDGRHGDEAAYRGMEAGICVAVDTSVPVRWPSEPFQTSPGPNLIPAPDLKHI